MEGSGSRILVEDGEGGNVAVNVTNETGAVVGQVLTDAGFGLPDASVTVWGAPVGAATNATGWFQIPDVPPGIRPVHVEHPGYHPAENDVEVAAGEVTRITVTLLPSEANAGYRPHVHDYWGARSEVVAIDRDFQFHRSPYPGGLGVAFAAVRAFQTAEVSVCHFASNQPAMGTSAINFDESTQLVWPGTGRIDVVLSWNPLDYVGAETLALTWRAPNASSFTNGAPLKNGQPFSIPVDAPAWDVGHQRFTLWEFYVCLKGQGERTTVAGQPVSNSVYGRFFLGKFHATMTLIRGLPILVDPPHPRFWSTGATLEVLNETKTLACDAANVAPCQGAAYQGRTAWPTTFVWRPQVPSLVPPGTKTLLVNLSWAYSLPIENLPLSVTYSPASIPPHEKVDHTKYQRFEAAERGAAHRVYRLSVTPDDVDGFYQGRSNWAFLWGHEGEESNPTLVHRCACKLTVSLRVTAVSEEGQA
ncbi:MAG: carboxypeptidase regulatory-like domain-containing protein [Euryarchaeota archaeon]|nr:carboxypeptidase regulatory-like domain-containing protein [Euryarchaeota archaeon]